MTAQQDRGQPVHDDLESWIDEELGDLDVPGLAVGVHVEGREQHVFRGVTSVDNPLDVDASTIFRWASVTKTVTATLIMHLVSRGDIDLDALVHEYLPALRLKDENALASLRVSHLLNHTAGWTGDIPYSPGGADGSFLEALGHAQQLTPPGSLVSYNNAALIVAGELVTNIAGFEYADAVRRLILEPLSLKNTYIDAVDVMTRRFAVGHELHDGRHVVVGPWPVPTYAQAAGGLAGTSEDLLRWARFHLGDPDMTGDGVLPLALRNAMRTATAKAPGSELGDATGIGWLLRDVDGIAFAGHSGVATGQVARIDLAPDRGFAVSILVNSGTYGPRVVSRVRRRIVRELLSIDYSPPQSRPFTPDASRVLAGRYATEELVIDVTSEDGTLLLTIRVAPRDPRTGERQPTGEVFTVPVGAVLGESERHCVGLQGQFAGVRGRFIHDEALRLDALDFGGRLALRETRSVHR